MSKQQRYDLKQNQDLDVGRMDKSYTEKGRGDHNSSCVSLEILVVMDN